MGKSRVTQSRAAERQRGKKAKRAASEKRAAEILAGFGYDTEAKPELLQALAHRFAYFELNDHAPFHALMALALIWTARSSDAADPEDSYNGHDPLENIEIPWWVACSLGLAWMRSFTDEMPIDKSLGLQGMAQGESPHFAAYLKNQQDMHVALRIAQLIASGQETKVDGAVKYAAEEFSIGCNAAYEAWRRYGAPAKKTVERFTGKTS
jgi:hypothetical protein